MGQPSATKHLKTLEAAVGERLVQRDGRASRLTPAGEIVAIHAQRVLDTFEGMHEELRALRGAELGTLTLAASTTPGSYVLPSLLECFAERHPRVEVDVVIGSSRWVAERVAHREVSLGMAGELDWPDGVIAEPFLEDEIVGIAPPGRLPSRASLELIARVLPTTRTCWASKRPSSAALSAGSFLRSWPRARSASTTGSVVPDTSASSIARPDLPIMSVATVSSLIPVSCITLCSRFISRWRSRIWLLR
jgi:DNA-binding transcriptional LysR family regulator